MRTFQFWILIFASTIVCGMMIKQVFLMRELNQLERTMSDSQDVIKNGSQFENAWKQMAMRLYQVGHQDPAILDLLKKEDVEVHAAPPPASGATTPAASTPSVAPKAPVAPPHPATP